jgi:uncharacterized membrane protein YhdT
METSIAYAGRAKRARGSVIGTVFALIFIVVGLAAGAFFAKGWFDWLGAQSWEPVPATLYSVELDENSSSDGTTYRVRAEYEYFWRGERFVGTRVDLHPGADNLGDYHQRLYRRLDDALRSGQAVTAWVDPDRPDRAVLDREMRWGRLAIGMIFPMGFGGIGLFFLWAMRRGARADKQLERNRERWPEQPWMWHEDWRTPELVARSSATMWLAIAFAVLWNLVSAPVAFLVPGEIADGNWPALAGLLFPIVGIGLIVWAVREVLRKRRYGDSVLRLDSLPVPLGGMLRATFEVPARLADRELEVQLACVHRFRSGSGKNRRTREVILWEDRQQATARSGSAPGSTAARIEMPLPLDQPAARRQPTDDTIFWRLTVEAEEPGVDFKGQFELPVFETEITEAARENPQAALDQRIESEAWRETGVEYGRAAGGQRFYFPRLRMLGAGLVLLLFSLPFSGAGIFLMIGEGQWIFGGIFALAGTLILLGALSMLFQRSEMIVGLERLRWRHGVFGGWQEVDAGEIRSLDVARSGSAGRRVYYRLQLRRFGQERKTTIADWLPGERPARALARKITGLAGVRREPDGARSPSD